MIMATFIPYEAYKISEKYTEPCNSCFKNITYNVKAVIDDPRVTGGKCIICPRCGRLMSVHFANIILCKHR